MVLLVLLASGCVCSPGNGGNVSQTTVTQPSGSVQTTTTVKSGGVLSDLAAVISSGQAYSCNYTYDNVHNVMVLKGQKYKSDVTYQGKAGHVISDGVWAYTWSEGQNAGIKFNIADMNQQNTQTSGTVPDLTELARTATGVRCTPTVISDSAFTPPANIRFQDMGELVKRMQQGQIGG